MPDTVTTDLERRVGIHRTASSNYERDEIERAVLSTLSHVGLRPEGPPPGRGVLASLVSPGDTVLLKPNMVREADSSSGEWDCLITHGEVVRAVAMLAAQALDAHGKIVVADGPHMDSDFSAAAAVMQLQALQREVSEMFGIELEVLDLREAYRSERPKAADEMRGFPGDPKGYVDFDLADRSEFRDRSPNVQLRSNDQDLEAIRSAHSAGRHRYRVARTPLEADVVINLPKMKTHQKTGVTLSLKNVVGIHGNRNYLPHFTAGHRDDGGDESPWTGKGFRARRSLIRGTKRVAGWVGPGESAVRLLRLARSGPLAGQAIKDGNWHGNDTAWRMVLDLNKIFYHGRPDGSLMLVRARQCLTIVDGVVAGEGDGPIDVHRKAAGLMVAGLNPVAVDSVCSIVMGFDPHRMEMLDEAWRIKDLPLVYFAPGDVECFSDVAEWNGNLKDLLRAPHCGFAPPSGWRGYMERDGVRLAHEE